MRKNILLTVLLAITIISSGIAVKLYLDNQMMHIYNLQNNLNNAHNNDLLNLTKINKTLQDKVKELEETKLINIIKPDYKYLDSITVYIEGEIPEKTNEDNSVRIRASWAGTGSIICVKGEETYILTNAHVVGEKSEYKDEVILKVIIDKEQIEATIVKVSDKYDMAVIKVKGLLKGKSVIKGFSTARIQDDVFSVGNYLGMEGIYSEGTVAGYNKDMMICNLPCAFGCSGSIVTNSKGEGIGLVFAIFKVGLMGQDTAKAICVRGTDIINFLQELKLI